MPMTSRKEGYNGEPAVDDVVELEQRGADCVQFGVLIPDPAIPAHGEIVADKLSAD